MAARATSNRGGASIGEDATSGTEAIDGDGAIDGADGAPSSDAADPDGAFADAHADGGPSCRAGCTCEWYFGHRYMLCPDKLLYTAARDFAVRTACGSFA